ncbi:MAG: hypothetical protein IKC47_01280 [Clostridia bacterium]|nr:hypothetical protein [Clostridia bacterium]
MNVKNCGKIMERYLINFFGYRPNMSDFGSDVSFCVYDDFSGRTLEILGGDYESSVTFTVSRWGELSVETYVSNARARVLAPHVTRLLQQVHNANYYTSSTRYVPGESALSFKIWLKNVDDGNMNEAMEALMKGFGFVFVGLGKV